MGNEAFTERKTENYRGFVTFFSGFGIVPDAPIGFGNDTNGSAVTSGSSGVFWNGLNTPDPNYPIKYAGNDIGFVANTLYVSPSGNDVLGRRQNRFIPFATVSGAMNYVQPGDVIEVFPGSYVEQSMPCPSNVTVFYHPNTYVTSASGAYSFFWNSASSAASNFQVRGYANFVSPFLLAAGYSANGNALVDGYFSGCVFEFDTFSGGTILQNGTSGTDIYINFRKAYTYNLLINNQLPIYGYPLQVLGVNFNFDLITTPSPSQAYIGVPFPLIGFEGALDVTLKGRKIDWKTSNLTDGYDFTSYAFIPRRFYFDVEEVICANGFSFSNYSLVPPVSGCYIKIGKMESAGFNFEFPYNYFNANPLNDIIIVDGGTYISNISLTGIRSGMYGTGALPNVVCAQTQLGNGYFKNVTFINQNTGICNVQAGSGMIFQNCIFSTTGSAYSIKPADSSPLSLKFYGTSYATAPIANDGVNYFGTIGIGQLVVDPSVNVPIQIW